MLDSIRAALLPGRAVIRWPIKVSSVTATPTCPNTVLNGRGPGVLLAVGSPVRRRVRLYGEPVEQADNKISLWTV